MKSFAALPMAAGLIALASAQQQYNIDPTSVSDNLKNSWCSTQTNTCPYICTQVSSDGSMTTNTNTCDAESLSYSCICGDGTTPNVTEYTQTLPFFICQTWGDQCVHNCGLGNNDCASDCREDHPCGAQNPAKGNATMTSSSTGTKTMTGSMSSETGDSEASSTGSDSDGGVYTGFGGAQQTDGPDSDNADDASDTSGAALMAGQTFGLVAVAGAFFGGFALLL